MYPLYFDTDVLEQICRTFSTEALPDRIRRCISLSPLSLLELLQGVATDPGSNALERIHALANVVNPKCAPILPHHDAAISMYAFERSYDDNEFTEKLGEAINVCLATNSVEDVRDATAEVRTVLERDKVEAARHFSTLVNSYRNQVLGDQDWRDLFVKALAGRVGAMSAAYDPSKVAARLGAHFRYETEKLRTASQSRDYNAQKHRNDHLDSQQLVWLANPRQLRFLTGDARLYKVAKASLQGDRVFRTVPSELATPALAVDLLMRVAVAN